MSERPLSADETITSIAHGEHALQAGTALSWQRDALHSRMGAERADAAMLGDHAVSIHVNEDGSANAWRLPVDEMQALPQPHGMLVGAHGQWVIVALEDSDRLLVAGLPSFSHRSGTPGATR